MSEHARVCVPREGDGCEALHAHRDEKYHPEREPPVRMFVNEGKRGEGEREGG